LAILSCHLPLITIHISDCRQFSDVHISQGSVETYLRCGGIFEYDFAANLPVSLSVKAFGKSVNIWRSYGQEFSVLFFTHNLVCKCNVADMALRIFVLFQGQGFSSIRGWHDWES